MNPSRVERFLSGADRMKPGKLELASGGTLFLDEIGELSLVLQVKLLRVLEQKSFYRLGGIAPIRADFRLVAATHRDLKVMCGAGSFREDLFYRIHVVTIRVPSLRERPDDIEPLLKFFMAKFSQELGKDIRGIERQTLDRLKTYNWLGNVRELKNMVERMVALSEEPVLTGDLLPLEVSLSGPEDAPGSTSLADRVAMLERQMITQAMKKAQGKKSAAAKQLQISRPTLDKKLSEYAINVFDEE